MGSRLLHSCGAGYFIDKTGKRAADIQVQDDHAYHDGNVWRVLNVAGRYQVFDNDLKPLSDDGFTFVNPFVAGYALCTRAETKNAVGVLHESGELVLPTEFDELRPLMAGQAAARTGDRWCLYDLDVRKYLVEPGDRLIGTPGETRTTFKSREGLYGFLGRDGDVVIEPRFKGLGWRFSEGVAAVSLD